MKHLFKAKWTSIEKLYGWRHYEVLNVFKNKQEVELFCVCQKDIKFNIPIKELKDKSKWLEGWQGK